MNLTGAPLFRKSTSGFSLVQISIILTVAAIIAASLIPGGDSASDLAKQQITVARMIKIEEAIRTWRAFAGYNMCPADGSLAIGNANFGRGVGYGTGTCSSVNFTSGNIVAGVVPTVTLKLPDEDMFDGWGRRFTYVVDQRTTAGNNLTLQGSCTPQADYIWVPNGSSTVFIYAKNGSGGAPAIAAGDIIRVQGAPDNANGSNIPASHINGYHTITGASSPGTPAGDINMSFNQNISSIVASPDYVFWYGGPQFAVTRGNCTTLSNAGAPYGITVKRDAPLANDTAMVVIISHGKNGHGAFPARGSTVAGRFNSGSTDTDELDNASVDAAFATNFNATFVKKMRSSTFDDIVRYSQKCQ